MSGFLDRLASRTMGEAPLVHPRVRTRFEPDAGGLPAAPAEEIAQVAEVLAAPRRPLEVREPMAAPRTFEPEVRSVSAERPVAAHEDEFEKPEKNESRLRRDPRPLAPSPIRTHTHAGEGEPGTKAFAGSPPLPGEGSASGTGGRGVRVHRAAPPEELTAGPLRDEKRSAAPLERRRPAALAPVPAEPEPQPLLPALRPRSALTEELPTVGADRRAPLPPSLEENEPSETVVHVSIGRIDVRASQPPASERRPARPIAGPRLSLEDYLKRREERRQ